MKHKILALCLLFCSICAVGQTRKMSAAEQTDFQNSLKKVAALKTLSADFVQYKHMKFMNKPIESSGKLYVKQPDKLSWSYVAPFKYSMLFKDRKIYINDAGKKKTIDLGSNKQFEKISTLITSSMAGAVYDEKEFSVAYNKTASYNQVVLTPKLADTKKYIKQIELNFSRKDQQVEEVKLTEPSADYTLFVLKNRKINIPLDESLFKH